MEQLLPQPQDQNLKEPHLRDFLRIMVRRRKGFIITFLTVTAAALLCTWLQAPVYESTATLLIKEDKEKAGQLGDLLVNGAAAVNSELEILKSRSNVEKVVAGMHLDWKLDDVSEGVRVTPVHFASTAKNPVYLVELTGGGGYRVKDDKGKTLGTGVAGSLMREKGVALLLRDLQGGNGDSFRISLMPFNQTVDDLRGAIRAEEIGKKTNIMAVSYRNTDRWRARDVVNALVQAYLEQGIAIKAEEATRAVDFIEGQLTGIREELESAERNLEIYKSRTGVVQLDAEARRVIDALVDSEKQRAGVALQRKQVEFALASLREARRGGEVYSPSLLREDPLVAGMAARLAELEVQKRGALSDSTEAHPSVKGFQAQIDEVQKKLQATYESSVKDLGQREDNLAREIERHDGQLKRLPVAERDLARLMRLSKVNSDIYTFLLQKREEARIARASTISNMKVIDPAIAADLPVAPNKKRNILVGLLLGIFSGIACSFFTEYTDDTMKDLEQIKLTLGMPVLAAIPFLGPKGWDAGLGPQLALQSPASEAFRTLRAGLHFCCAREERKVMLVTSALFGEGKSTVASNLAITLAQAGKKVLILDCDLRKPSLHRTFSRSRKNGLGELLSGELDAAVAVESCGVPGLDLVQAGAHRGNPADLLGSERMARFMGEVKGGYDHVVIDAPPLLAVSDPLLLTRYCDLAILVLEPTRVRVDAALRARELLTASAVPVAGVVVTDRDQRSPGYGYGYGYAGSPRTGREWWSWKRRRSKGEGI